MADLEYATRIFDCHTRHTLNSYDTMKSLSDHDFGQVLHRIDLDDSKHHIIACAALILVAYGLISFIQYLNNATMRKFWNSQAWAGIHSRLLARTRAGFHAIRHTREVVEQGYEKYSRHDRPFVLPKFGNNPVLVLPPSQARELVRKPDDEVDLHIIHWEQLANRYTSRPEVFMNALHLQVVKRQITRKLPTFSDDLYCEMAAAFAANWDPEKDCTNQVAVYRSCIKIVSRAANRVLSGIELCRNPEFLTGSWQYTLTLFTAAARINMLPTWLRPLAAPFLTAATNKHFAQCLKAAEPVIKKRLAEVQLQGITETGKIHNDAMQWVIEESIEQGRPIDLKPEIICRRVLAMNMVAIHTTSIAVTNAFLDLFHSPDAADFISELRKECDTVLAAHNGQWTKAALNELVLVDSAIKESMRLSVRVIGMHRMVTRPDGIDFNGLHVPRGVRIALPNHHIQRDPDTYADAERYNAFRFAAPGGTKDAGAYLQQKQNTLSMPGEHFLAWGHGRHACPGRFFAAHLMKIMLAHVLVNYEITAVGPKPEGISRNEFPVPSITATFGVQRR